MAKDGTFHVMSYFTTIKKIKWKENVSCIQSLKDLERPTQGHTWPQNTVQAGQFPRELGTQGRRRPCGNSGQVQGTECGGQALHDAQEWGREAGSFLTPRANGNYRALKAMRPTSTPTSYYVLVFLLPILVRWDLRGTFEKEEHILEISPLSYKKSV